MNQKLRAPVAVVNVDIGDARLQRVISEDGRGANQILRDRL